MTGQTLEFPVMSEHGVRRRGHSFVVVVLQLRKPTLNAACGFAEEDCGGAIAMHQAGLQVCVPATQYTRGGK